MSDKFLGVIDVDENGTTRLINELRAEIKGLKSAYEIMRNVADSRKAEVERLTEQRDQWTEDAINQAGESARQDEVIERLQQQIIAISEAAIKYGINDQVGAALAHAEIVAGTKGNHEQAE